MTEARFELWLPIEQTYTREPPPARTGDADPDEQAFTDLHGPQPQHRAYRTTVTVHRPETCCDRDRAH